MYNKLLTATAVSIALSGCLADEQRSTASQGNSSAFLEINERADVTTLLTTTLTDRDLTGEAAATYQWYTGSVAAENAISGATESSFQVDMSHEGVTLYVQAMFNDGKRDEVATDSVAVAEDTVGEVAVSGDTNVAGDVVTMTLSDGDTLDTDVEVVYTWYRVVADADDLVVQTNTVTGISDEGTSSDTYALTDDDIASASTLYSVVEYTDSLGFVSSVTSAETLTLGRIDIPGVVSISSDATGDSAVGDVLTVAITDEDAISDTNPEGTIDPADATYDWMRDGVSIVAAVTGTVSVAAYTDDSTYTLTADDVGKVITVAVKYSDGVFDDGESETAPGDNVAPIFTTTVTSGTALKAALDVANEGDAIALDSGDYADLGDVSLATKGIKLYRTAAAMANDAVDTATASDKAAITGEFCLALEASDVTAASEGVTVDGLHFSQISHMGSSAPCSDASSDQYYVTSLSPYSVITNNIFDTEVSTTSRTVWLHVGSNDSYIARNSFTGHIDERGAYIKLDGQPDDTDDEVFAPRNHVVEYNYLSGYANSGSSDTFAIMVGNDTGTKANNYSNMTVRFNLIEGEFGKTRTIYVKTSGSRIYGNTLVDAIGGIALENGRFNKVSYNVVVGQNASNETGIDTPPYGHEITHNYFAGRASGSSSQRAPLILSSEQSGDTSNSAIEPVLVRIENNTVVNSKSVFLSNAKGCGTLTGRSEQMQAQLRNNYFLQHSFDEETELTGLGGNQGASHAVYDIDATADCAAHSVAGDVAYTTKTLVKGDASGGDLADLEDGVDGNRYADEPLVDAENNIDDSPVLVGGFAAAGGADEGKGADATKLHRIMPTDVGAGSTWSSSVVAEYVEIPEAE